MIVAPESVRFDPTLIRFMTIYVPARTNTPNLWWADLGPGRHKLAVAEDGFVQTAEAG